MLNIDDSSGDSDDDDDWEERTDLDSSSTDSLATEYLPLQRVDPTDSHKRKYFPIIRNSKAQKRYVLNSLKKRMLCMCGVHTQKSLK